MAQKRVYILMLIVVGGMVFAFFGLNSNVNQKSALVSAAAGGDLEVVVDLIGVGAPVNIKANDGWTPLTISVVNGHYAVVKYLLQNGADVNMKEAGGKSALFWARYYEHSDLVELLVEHGAEE